MNCLFQDGSGVVSVPTRGVIASPSRPRGPVEVQSNPYSQQYQNKLAELEALQYQLTKQVALKTFVNL